MGLNEPQDLGVFSDASMDETELSDIKAMHAGNTLDIFYDTREKTKHGSGCYSPRIRYAKYRPWNTSLLLAFADLYPSIDIIVPVVP